MEPSERRFRPRRARPNALFSRNPGEFLQYCQSLPLLDGILALMDFEYTQLLAEVAQIPDIPDIHYSNDSKYTPFPAAFIRQYRYDVTDDLHEAETALLIWRNAEDDVMYQTLDGFDMMLLEIMGSSALSFDTLAQTLVEFMPEDDNWKNILLGKWSGWTEQRIIIPPCPPYPKIWKAIPGPKPSIRIKLPCSRYYAATRPDRCRINRVA